MYLFYLLFYSLLINVEASVEDVIVIDYFIYKEISRVVGYSCNLLRDDLQLMKQFSKKEIMASIFKLGNESNINDIAYTNYWKLGIFLDIHFCDVEHVAAIFNKATDHRMYDELRDWFVLSDDLESILKVINDKAFGLSTNFVIAVANDTRNYKLYDVYNRHKDRGSTMNVTLYGSWNEGSRLIISLQQSKLARRSNFHNLKLKTMFYKTIYKPDEMSQAEYYEKSPNGIKEGLSKFGFIILKHLGDLYNFSFECFETEALKPGDALGPLARSLVNFQADLAGTPLTMTTKRSYLLKYVHVGLPLRYMSEYYNDLKKNRLSFRTCFIFRNPQQTTIKVQEIFRPFAKSVWYLMCINIIVFILVLNLTLIYDRSHSRLNKISNSFIMTIGAICQQSSDIYLNNYSTKLVFFVILIFSLIIYDYYSASVVSARLDEPIQKINDSLVELGKLHLGMASERIVYINIFWKAQIWETQVFYQNYWLNLPENKRYMDPELGMRLVQKGGFAYHVHPDVAYILIEKYFDNREICELMEVHLGRPQDTMFSVTNNCTFEEVLRVGLTKISEVGLRRRQINKWQYRKPQCRKDILSASSINMYEFAPHLILLFVGMLLAIFVFTFEVVNLKYVIELPNNE